MILDPVKVVQPISNSASLVDNFPIALAEVARGGCELNKSDSFSLWHHRLGHAPMSKLKYTDIVPAKVNDNVCVTLHVQCPKCSLCLFIEVLWLLVQCLNFYIWIFGDLIKLQLTRTTGFFLSLWMILVEPHGLICYSISHRLLLC